MRRGDIEIRMEENNSNNKKASSCFCIREWECWLLVLFISAECVIFYVSLGLGKCTERNGYNLCTSALEKFGGFEWNKVVHQHQRWRLITSIWLHGGAMHLCTSIISFVCIGMRFGELQWCSGMSYLTVRLGIIYLLSGIGGTILSSLFIKQSVSVGASGAILGLFGAQFSVITYWPSYTNKVSKMKFPWLLVIINVAVGFLPHIGNFVHIGGFITGFLLAFVLLPPPQSGRVESQNLSDDVRVDYKYNGYQIAHRLLALILLVAWFVVGFFLLFRGMNAYKYCHWCRYLGCVSNFIWKCDL